MRHFGGGVGHRVVAKSTAPSADLAIPPADVDEDSEMASDSDVDDHAEGSDGDLHLSDSAFPEPSDISILELGEALDGDLSDQWEEEEEGSSGSGSESNLEKDESDDTDTSSGGESDSNAGDSSESMYAEDL